MGAVCDNDARRAKALLAVLPEAAMVQRPGHVCNQLPLEYAAHHGRVALTRVLLEARAQVDATREGLSKATPLQRAVERGNSKTALLLLEAGADASRAVDAGKRLRGKAAELLEL